MYLLDTDIIIYSLKGESKVVSNFNLYKQAPKALSVITYGELIYGAKRSKNKISNLAKNTLKEMFPIINISPAIMEIFGEIKASLFSKGNVLDDFDMLIASTALSFGYTLVTNNEKHFSKINELKIANWNK